MKLQIVALIENSGTQPQRVSQTFVQIFPDFSYDIGEVADIPLKAITNDIPLINGHMSIKKHSVLQKVPNLPIQSSSYDITSNIQTFCFTLKDTPKIFLSKTVGRATQILSAGIIFSVLTKNFFTNLKGKCYYLDELDDLQVSPGSFIINTTTFAIPQTIPMEKEFGFKLTTYLQRLNHPWTIAPIQASLKKSYLLPKIAVLLSKPMEEVTDFIFSLKDNMSSQDLINALDRTAYYSEYNLLRATLRVKVQSLSFPTSYTLVLSEFSGQQLRLAESILLLEIDSFRDLNSSLLI
jgi:hypothetical protein